MAQTATVLIPTYSIARGPDLSPQFNPPVGSLELADALAFKYPLEPDLESRIRRALMDHWTLEQHASSATEQQPELAPKVISGMSVSFEEVAPTVRKRKRSQFNTAKRKKVAAVRKHGACEFHRKKKLECTCPFPQTASKEEPASNLEMDESPKEPLSSIEMDKSPAEPPTPVSETTFSGIYAFDFSLPDWPAENNNNQQATIDFESWFST